MGTLIEIACLNFIRGQHVLKTCTIQIISRTIFTNTSKLTREVRKIDESRTKHFIDRHVRNFKDKYIRSLKEPTKESAEVLSNIKKDSENGNGDFNKPPSSDAPNVAAKDGIFMRFKNTYKQHGKVFIGVHLVTSSIWTAIFYSAVISGVDISALLKWIGVGETILQKLNSPSLGHIATTYLLYKLATPLRYTATVAGTRYVVKYLQGSGRMPITPEKNKLSSLLKEGHVHINKRRYNPKRHR